MSDNRIRSVRSIGYGFIDDACLPTGKDEYHLRNLQNRNGITYRNLTAYEIEVLVRNSNTSDDWNMLQVSDAFNPELVKQCKFFGLVRIGKLESIAIRYHNVTLPVGLYNSTIISCDFGDNVMVSNVNYMSHYIVGNEVMISNIHELHTTDHSKFGNGVIKEGEEESVRVWLEVRNENAGRKILPFNGMLPGDAYLWSKYRADKALMQRFKELTEERFDKQRGYYGKIGDRCVIKNTSIIKDVWIGSDAYIKGANKLKNLTINSTPEAATQIGEGCELVNGIIGYGCRIFYGSKAVRFIMASHSQLKYGARLINSYLGNNATISCCEVLNSLIYPAHEQHHNNSFLCAGLIMGQSNIAAGATIGSNHNSRAADGEIIAGRGFWPGLCVSLKHNSKFASFVLIAKGDYSSELNIQLPFSLVSNDEMNNRLVVMPAYWFQYNMYALARNAAKYVDRDNRLRKLQRIEYDYLAPDSVNEIFTGLKILEESTGRALEPGTANDADYYSELGRKAILENDPRLKGLTITVKGFENASRETLLVKVPEACRAYRNMVHYYGVQQLLPLLEDGADLQQAFTNAGTRTEWHNVGGQLIPEDSLQQLLDDVRSGKVKTWDVLHEVYREEGRRYDANKQQHALASLLELHGIKPADISQAMICEWLDRALQIRTQMTEGIYQSRAKDYESPYRKMTYDSMEEMNEVVGRLEDNVFIRQQQEELALFRSRVEGLKKRD